MAQSGCKLARHGAIKRKARNVENLSDHFMPGNDIEIELIDEIPHTPLDQATTEKCDKKPGNTVTGLPGGSSNVGDHRKNIEFVPAKESRLLSSVRKAANKVKNTSNKAGGSNLAPVPINSGAGDKTEKKTKSALTGLFRHKPNVQIQRQGTDSVLEKEPDESRKESSGKKNPSDRATPATALDIVEQVEEQNPHKMETHAQKVKSAWTSLLDHIPKADIRWKKDLPGKEPERKEKTVNRSSKLEDVPVFLEAVDIPEAREENTTLIGVLPADSSSNVDAQQRAKRVPENDRMSAKKTAVLEYNLRTADDGNKLADMAIYSETPVRPARKPKIALNRVPGPIPDAETRPTMTPLPEEPVPLNALPTSTNNSTTTAGSAKLAEVAIISKSIEYPEQKAKSARTGLLVPKTGAPEKPKPVPAKKLVVLKQRGSDYATTVFAKNEEPNNGIRRPIKEIVTQIEAKDATPISRVEGIEPVYDYPKAPRPKKYSVDSPAIQPLKSVNRLARRSSLGDLVATLPELSASFPVATSSSTCELDKLLPTAGASDEIPNTVHNEISLPSNKPHEYDALMTGKVSIKNTTKLPLHISLWHISPIHYSNNVQPGEWCHFITGKVWFTIKARVADGTNEYTLMDNVRRIAGIAFLGLGVAGISALSILSMQPQNAPK